MMDKKIPCLSCGVFRMEIEALTAQRKLNQPIIMLESMLHMKPAKLEQEMDRVLADGTNEKFLILYGDCHAHMHEMEERRNVSKVFGINCCDILLGREAYSKLQKAQAFIFLPEWTQRWQEVFSTELGFKKPEVAQAFMREHRKRLVYVDTGVIPVPDKTLQDISDFFGMQIEVMHISLEILLQGINKALQKFMRHDQNDK